MDIMLSDAYVIPAEMARMWADRLDGHAEELAQWSRYSSCWHEAEDLAAILDRLDALADDIRKAPGA
jgi:hypothetical protein